MRSPTFEEIWTENGWQNYDTECLPKRDRSYFQIRSCFRMALWIPIVVTMAYWFLQIAGGKA